MAAHKNLNTILKHHFGFSKFRKGQQEIVEAILEGKDCIGVLPTGQGKSVCYQLPALILDGVTIVVSPLLALMKDQVDSLNSKIEATCINSTLSNTEQQRRVFQMVQGKFKLVYVAPERFRNVKFMQALSQIKLALVAIDEAHCISMWGHDFRPDYQRIKEVLKILEHPQVAAFTATATPQVRRDIKIQLGLGGNQRGEPAVVVGGFSRNNLFLSVERVSGKDSKLRQTKKILKNGNTGIVYCATRKNVDKVVRLLQQAGISCVGYHGGMNDYQRKNAQDQFVQRKVPVAVATNAFGMGIDRQDISAIIHWDIPGSMEAYYQEAGRAGRNGQAARCELLFNFADVKTQEFFIEGSNPSPRLVKRTARAIKNLCGNKKAQTNITEIKKELAGKINNMALQTTIRHLHKIGFLTQQQTDPSNEPTIAVDNLNADLENMLQSLEKKATHDNQRLKAIIDYVKNRQECRHDMVLSYFEDKKELETAHCCDNCQRQITAAAHTSLSEPTEKQWVEIQIILSCIARLKGRFGRFKVIQILKGSKDKEILRLGLNTLSTYGLLKEHTREYLNCVIEKLEDLQCIATEGETYPTIVLTTKGNHVMKRKIQIQIDWPKQTLGIKSNRSTIPSKTTDLGGTCNLELVEKLKRWRLNNCRKLAVPAYQIINNATLSAIATQLPTDEETLLAVPGIGPVKASQFGPSILKIISDYLEKA